MLKRKMITAKQLQKLIDAGIVKRVEGSFDKGYRIEGEDIGTLFDGEMYECLIGKTRGVRRYLRDDLFPFDTINDGYPSYHVPYWVLACNYKKLLRG